MRERRASHSGTCGVHNKPYRIREQKVVGTHGCSSCGLSAWRRRGHGVFSISPPRPLPVLPVSRGVSTRIPYTLHIETQADGTRDTTLVVLMAYTFVPCSTFTDSTSPCPQPSPLTPVTLISMDSSTSSPPTSLSPLERVIKGDAAPQQAVHASRSHSQRASTPW